MNDQEVTMNNALPNSDLIVVHDAHLEVGATIPVDPKTSLVSGRRLERACRV